MTCVCMCLYKTASIIKFTSGRVHYKVHTWTNLLFKVHKWMSSSHRDALKLLSP